MEAESEALTEPHRQSRGSLFNEPNAVADFTALVFKRKQIPATFSAESSKKKS